jgi:hypothetical protein
MKTMKRMVVLALVGLSVAVGGAQVARAVDAKVYPGALCVPAAAWNQSLSRGQSTGTMTVINFQKEIWCPIIGDNENSSLGLSKIKVYMLESSSTAAGDNPNTVCTVYSDSALDGLPSDSAQMTASSGIVTLSTTMTSKPPVAPARYVMKCVLTAGSTLHEYEIEEK